jgi:hypothetical protein
MQILLARFLILGCFDLNALFLESVFQPYFSRVSIISAITLIDLSYSLLNITNLVLVLFYNKLFFFIIKYLKLYHTCS